MALCYSLPAELVFSQHGSRTRAAHQTVFLQGGDVVMSFLGLPNQVVVAAPAIDGAPVISIDSLFAPPADHTLHGIPERSSCSLVRCFEDVIEIQQHRRS